MSTVTNACSIDRINKTTFLEKLNHQWHKHALWAYRPSPLATGRAPRPSDANLHARLACSGIQGCARTMASLLYHMFPLAGEEAHQGCGCVWNPCPKVATN